MIDYIETTNAENELPLIIYIDEIIRVFPFGNNTEIITRNGVFYAAEKVETINKKITIAKIHRK